MSRKLGDPAPNKLMVEEGIIIMQDGSDPTDYINEWQEINGIADKTKICIVTKESIENLEARLKFLLTLTFV